jgi:iron-sulfur cluster repair protein YtfE (RIC family)
MARVIMHSDMSRCCGGDRELDVAATSYRELVAELCERYDGLSEELVRKHAIAIDGMIVHEPLLERFGADSELVFVAKIAGG